MNTKMKIKRLIYLCFIACILFILIFKYILPTYRLRKALGELNDQIDPAFKDRVTQVEHLFIVIDKSSQQVFLYDQEWQLVEIYQMTAFSGKEGPKLREGDSQIPEGKYSITHLNPQSSFHLSLKLSYPNSLDLKQNPKDPGNNIYIHGKDASIGCIAIGDKNIERLFYAANEIGLSHITVYSYSPSLIGDKKQSEHVRSIYKQLEQELLPHLEE